MPKVSVVMPVYNGLPYLESAVESILKQDYSDFEFVIIDDGSTDGSTEVLEKLGRRHSQIKLVSRENRGLISSLNEGISIAEGEYIARMDADDISLPRRLGLQVDYLDQHPNCVLVGGQVVLMDREGKPVLDSSSPPVESRTGRVGGLWEEHELIERSLLDGGWPLVHPAVMMRRDSVVQVDGYDERFKRIEDHDLFLKLAEVGDLANLPEMVLRYRRHENQITGQKVVDQNYYMRVIRKEAYIRREEPVPDDLTIRSMLVSWFGRWIRRTSWWRDVLNVYNSLIR